MEYTVVIEIDEERENYAARVREAPPEHRATASDPLDAIRGALIVSQGAIDDTVEYDRDEQR